MARCSLFMHDLEENYLYIICDHTAIPYFLSQHGTTIILLLTLNNLSNGKGNINALN